MTPTMTAAARNDATVYPIAPVLVAGVSALMPRYRNELCFHGGWDSIGPATQKDATEADVRGEVHRCIDTYGRDGNYMLFPVLFSDPADPRTELRYQWVADECRRYRPA